MGIKKKYTITTQIRYSVKDNCKLISVHIFFLHFTCILFSVREPSSAAPTSPFTKPPVTGINPMSFNLSAGLTKMANSTPGKKDFCLSVLVSFLQGNC